MVGTTLIAALGRHEDVHKCAYLEMPWFQDVTIKALILEPKPDRLVCAADICVHLNEKKIDLPRPLYILVAIPLPENARGEPDQDKLADLVFTAITMGHDPFV